MRKRSAALLATAIGASAMFMGAAPASAAVDPTPSTTTPDGKTVRVFEFVYDYRAHLLPAQTGDSVWLEVYGSTAPNTNKVTATSNTDLLISGSVVWGVYAKLRACAQTSAGVTCTAWNK
ncbi:hypothetical protein [Micromonospora tarensis]|uniref:Uncharacterized protein n=1 Tax=Micromonospora tarensis TaxID=2806100 RepID=A0ABS1YAU6_9ACTN|nr:hypothetical protein [Micromonospora tarensis]MBM0274454.1 hypothetical protein [Micromonospora tarensis]